jgi:hypothetical protein
MGDAGTRIEAEGPSHMATVVQPRAGRMGHHNQQSSVIGKQSKRISILVKGSECVLELTSLKDSQVSVYAVVVCIIGSKQAIRACGCPISSHTRWML